ncbi:MAG: DsbA family protein [Henriciella sp.]|nr:DsbA family protein [Henriciella sp.]
MSIKANLQNRVARHLFSPKRRDGKRRKAERQRQARSAPHVVKYYHELGDPYSHLMVQVLPEFCRRYDVELEIHIVAPPPDWAAPDRERLQSYSRRDAALLAAKAGLDYLDPQAQPSDDALLTGNTALLQAVKDGAFLQRAADIGNAVWGGHTVEHDSVDITEVASALTAAAKQRDADGHYLGATLHYAGEWYWGVDRLHYLESRLCELGAAKSDASEAIFAPPNVPSPGASPADGERPILHWYLSFRSPYTGIVAERVKALADSYDAELKLRYVLPMVMRGMQVPRAKGYYIMSDTVREAERLSVPFGKLVDPVGKPVERGYAILHKAIELGKGYEFVRSFLSGIWAEGLDAGSDRGLKAITERAGLAWSDIQPLLGVDHWQADAEANQAEMFSHGIWGVPSFRIGDTAIWGQDRLWVIEDALIAEQDKTK